MKAAGQKPSAQAYLKLLKLASDYVNRRAAPNDLGLAIAEAAIKDASAGKVDLGFEAIEELLFLSKKHPEILPSLVYAMQRRGQATPRAVYALGLHAWPSFEQMLLVAAESLAGNMPLHKQQLETLVTQACKYGQPRLALQLLQRAESMHAGTGVSSAAWVAVLTASAEASYLEGVEAGWNRAVANRAYVPDEGLLLAVLAVAGRWGRTDLATAALGQLANIKVRAQEHHFAPLLEAMCNEGRVPEALRLLGKMRAAGVPPILRTVQPLVKVLNSADVIDQAFYELEDMAAAGEAVDVAALNAVIAASAQIGDLQRARATQLAAESLNVQPDIDTFNLVLRACEKASHRVLGDTVLSELTAAGLQPNAETYQALILLCLTQNPFEDAFFYLEKMKAAGFTPPKSVYVELAFKCVRTDDKRWRLVVEEAQSAGYAMPPGLDRLRQSIEKGRAQREREPFYPRSGGERGEDGQRVLGRDYASRRRRGKEGEEKKE